jgi:hypothetical protein
MENLPGYAISPDGENRGAPPHVARRPGVTNTEDGQKVFE